MNMKTAEFHQNFELDTKTRAGVRANAKHGATAESAVAEIPATADGQTFFKSEIARLLERIAVFEAEKTNGKK